MNEENKSFIEELKEKRPDFWGRIHANFFKSIIQEKQEDEIR
jgi:hypothetical protein